MADRPDLAAATDAEVLDRIVGFDELFQRLWCSHIGASINVGLGLGGCGQVVAAIGRPELALVLSGGIGDVDSAGAAKDMWPLSRTVRESAHLTEVLVHRGHLEDALRADTHPDAVAFVAAFDTFLTRWGFRGPNEWELRSETWGTEPDTALAAIAAMSHAEEHASPEHGETARAAEREAATAQVHAAIAGDPAATAAFDGSLNAAHLFSRARERARMTAALLVHEQRLAARELGRRFVGRRELADARLVFMFTRSELIAHVRDGASVPRRSGRAGAALPRPVRLHPAVRHRRLRRAGSRVAAPLDRAGAGVARRSASRSPGCRGRPAWCAGRRSWSVTRAIRSPSRRAT